MAYVVGRGERFEVFFDGESLKGFSEVCFVGARRDGERVALLEPLERPFRVGIDVDVFVDAFLLFAHLPRYPYRAERDVVLAHDTPEPFFRAHAVVAREGFLRDDDAVLLRHFPDGSFVRWYAVDKRAVVIEDDARDSHFCCCCCLGYLCVLVLRLVSRRKGYK